MSNILFHTIVKAPLKRSVLIRGTLFAALGASCLLLGGIFFSQKTLILWGLPVFFLGLALITFGLLPYRKLAVLENWPNELVFGDDGRTFSFRQRGRTIFTMPLTTISKTTYCDKKSFYGIQIWLKQPLDEKILRHDPHFDLSAFVNKSQKNHACDISLPYFSHRAYHELRELLLEEDNNANC
jgi:hypothetical protein